MRGSVTETHYAEVREQAKSAQSQLSSFSSESQATTIAVVTEPRNTGIDKHCDEWRPELGMPERALKSFWSYRSGYRTNSAVSKPTERAYKDANLDERYRSYLEHSDEAQASLDELAEHVDSGGDITLVCFEEPGKPCHRHLLLSVLKTRIENNLRSIVAAD